MSHLEEDYGQYDSVAPIFWASGACMLVRTHVYKELGGLDANFFAHQEEIDLCWRMWRAGYKVCVEPRSVVYHLGGGTLPNNSPRKIYLNHRNNLAMLYKNLEAPRRAVIIGVRLILDGASAAVYMLSGKWEFVKAVWRAHRDFFARRENLRGKRTPSVAQPQGVYRGSIVLRYLLGKRTFDNMM